MTSHDNVVTGEAHVFKFFQASLDLAVNCDGIRGSSSKRRDADINRLIFCHTSHLNRFSDLGVILVVAKSTLDPNDGDFLTGCCWRSKEDFF